MTAHDCTLMYRTFLISHIVDDYQNHLKQLLLLTFTTITTFTAGYHHQNHVIFQFQKEILVKIVDEKIDDEITSPISLLFKSYRK